MSNGSNNSCTKLQSFVCKLPYRVSAEMWFHVERLPLLLLSVRCVSLFHSTHGAKTVCDNLEVLLFFYQQPSMYWCVCIDSNGVLSFSL